MKEEEEDGEEEEERGGEREEEDREGHEEDREEEDDGEEFSAHLVEFVFEELSPPATGHSWSGQVATPTDHTH